MSRPLESALRLTEALESFDVYLRFSDSPCPECRDKADEAKLDWELGVREAEDLEEWGR